MGHKQRVLSALARQGYDRWPVPTRYKDVAYSQGVYTEAAWRPFAGISDPAELGRFNFPSADWLDYSQMQVNCGQYPEHPVVTGTPGVLDFINGVGHSRGIEQVFIDIGSLDPVYLALIEMCGSPAAAAANPMRGA